MIVRCRIDQLYVDSNLIPGSLDTAFQDGGHAQFFTDRHQVFRCVAILHDGGSGNHLQSTDSRYVSQDVIVYAIDEEGVFLIGAPVGKGQDGN